MKKAIIVFVSVMSIIAFLIIGTCLYFNFKIVKHPFKEKNATINITINDGDTINGIIDRLDSQGKLNNGLLVKLYIKGKSFNSKGMEPGSINFKSDIDLQSFLDKLNGNKSFKDKDIVKITIPEGYNIEEIAAALEKAGLVTKKDFIASCQKYELPSFIKKDNDRRYTLEGYLFPDTYEFKKGVSSDKIIGTMLDRFNYVLDNIQETKGIILKDEDIDKDIIMASIVEKETKKSDERTIVASVFYNRLAKKMKLESCATDLYAMKIHKDRLSDKDTKFKSPYNTYVVEGLPVGPICCPGEASIEAALFPDKTDYLYFVYNAIKNDGSQVFSKTQQEHDAAVRKYLDKK